MAFRNAAQVTHRLIKIYGEKFLEYVLNIQDGSDTLVELSGGLILPSPERESAMRALQRTWEKCEIWDRPWNRNHELSAALTSSYRRNGSTFANQLKKSCGGHVEELFEDESDVLLRQYLRLITAAYPVIIMYLEKQGSGYTDSRAIIENLSREHPARSIFSDALKRDDLYRLFPNGEEGNWVWSTGNTSTYRPETIADELIYALVDHPQMRSRTTLETLGVIARETLSDARKLARGEAVDVPIIAGLSGIRVPHDKPSVIMEDPVSGKPKAWITTTLESRMIRRQPPFIVEEGLMCELVWYDKLQLLASNSVNTQDEIGLKIESGRRRRQQYLDHARLGIAASQPAESSKKPAVLVEERILSPLGPNGFIIGHESERIDIFMEPPGRPPGVDYSGWLILKTTELDNVQMTCTSLLNAAHNKSLALAARRLCLSLGIRNDPEDRLIDAVVGGEALVGGREPKQTIEQKVPRTKNPNNYTFAEVLAGLLEPDDMDCQREVMVDIISIMKLRNRIVHGSGRNPDNKEFGEIPSNELSDAAQRMSEYIGDASLLIAGDEEMTICTSSVERRKIIIERQQARQVSQL